MGKSKQSLHLVNDPEGSILWMLRSMPLERTVACLELVAGKADQLGLLSDKDKTRIVALLARVPVTRLDRAA